MRYIRCLAHSSRTRSAFRSIIPDREGRALVAQAIQEEPSMRKPIIFVIAFSALNLADVSTVMAIQSKANMFAVLAACDNISATCSYSCNAGNGARCDGCSKNVCFSCDKKTEKCNYQPSIEGQKGFKRPTNIGSSDSVRSVLDGPKGLHRPTNVGEKTGGTATSGGSGLAGSKTLSTTTTAPPTLSNSNLLGGGAGATTGSRIKSPTTSTGPTVPPTTGPPMPTR
jgi:hypothetical protein